MKSEFLLSVIKQFVMGIMAVLVCIDGVVTYSYNYVHFLPPYSHCKKTATESALLPKLAKIYYFYNHLNNYTKFKCNRITHCCNKEQYNEWIAVGDFFLHNLFTLYESPFHWLICSQFWDIFITNLTNFTKKLKHAVIT